MASETPLPLAATLAALPPAPPSTLRAQTQAALSSSSSSSRIPILVALDDDPTGTQTCNSINVLTVWDIDTLTIEFQATRPGSGFFVLTNSRALHPEPAFALISTICSNLQAASKATGVPFEIVLRGDSTLRGHFPLEADAATSVLGLATAWLLCPFFLQGGRYTINDVHYVAEGDTLVPAAQTPFAKDATFGYKNSDLKAYAVEKGKGAIAPEDVTSITLETIRNGGVDAVLAQLNVLEPKNGKAPVVVVNAAAEEDVDIVVLALLRATSTTAPGATPKRFLYRTGAAFVSANRTATPSTGDIVDTFCLIRGMNQVLAHSEDILHAGTFAPLFEAQSDASSTPLLDDVCDRLESLRARMESFTHYHILAHEIDRFIRWIRSCASTTNEAEMRVIMVWPIDLTTEYMSLLRQNEPQALILLAHYCAVAKGTESKAWYMQRWSTTAFQAVSDVLGSEWDSYLDWPRSVIIPQQLSH